MKRLLLTGVLLACAALPLPVSAELRMPAVCTGQMKFFNEDGTFRTYDLVLDLALDRYLITATDVESAETIEDTGTCETLMTTGCRHAILGADGQEEDFYTFTLTQRDGDRYNYKETWADGFSGETTLECRAAAGPDGK